MNYYAFRLKKEKLTRHQKHLLKVMGPDEVVHKADYIGPALLKIIDGQECLLPADGIAPTLCPNALDYELVGEIGPGKLMGCGSYLMPYAEKGRPTLNEDVPKPPSRLRLVKTTATPVAALGCAA
ncbi:MAG: hypothetical protein P4M15_03470 [Alphaproteobacteria bacterium]|nr:hypothetical protein [Alphaproteobacteria bacterium]